MASLSPSPIDPPPLRAVLPANLLDTPPACSVSVSLDSDGNKARSFGGVALQTIGKAQKFSSEPKSVRFARPETMGHSETENAAHPGLSGSHQVGKLL
jgi:hypothetical protein